jgi:anti-sigma28 factor (negative regulator of flagellin synthesis)
MRKPVALVVLVLALAGCSSNDTSSEPRASSETTTSTTTTSVVSTTLAAVANQTTTTTCREFADNVAVDLIRDAIANGSMSVDTFDVKDAFIAVFELEEVVAARPGLDQGVATAMNLASQQAQAQQSVWVDTAELDPVSFDRMLTGVDAACESAGVDMT